MKSIYKIASKFEMILKSAELTSGLTKTKAKLLDEQKTVMEQLGLLKSTAVKIQTKLNLAKWYIDNIDTLLYSGKEKAENELNDLLVAINKYDPSAEKPENLERKKQFLLSFKDKSISELRSKRIAIKNSLIKEETELGLLKINYQKLSNRLAEIKNQLEGIDSVETRGWLSD